MGTELQLFGFWSSAYSRRIELALKLKGVQYQYIEEDLPFNKSNLLLQYNPIYKKVPVLVHHGRPISESLLILEYIDETWTQDPIFPQDPYQRAQARFLAKLIDHKIMSAVLKAAGSRGEEREKAVEEAEEAFEALEKEMKKLLLFEHRIGVLDIVGTILTHWVPAIEDTFGFELRRSKDFPDLFKHGELKKFLPPKHDIVDFIKPNWTFQK